MFFPMGSEMREGSVNNPGLAEETINQVIEQTKRIRDTLDFSDCYSDLTKTANGVINMNNKQKAIKKNFTESERDVIRFSIWKFLYEAVDRINEIRKNKPITEDNIVELEVCLDNIRDSVSILSAFPAEEEYSYSIITKYTRKIEKIKRDFSGPNSQKCVDEVG